MIGSLRGKLIKKNPPMLILDVHGVGYELFAPMTTFYQLPSELTHLTEQKDVLLHTHLVVREDAQVLYGFIDQRDRDLFRLLIKINGVGPKLALGILSSIEREQFINAVQAGAADVLINIPGIGKKTADRLMIECKDLLKSMYTHQSTNTNSQLPMEVSILDQAIQAMVNLGYKAQDAKRVVEQVFKTNSSISLENLIRNALKQMVNV
jgi:Holliday junction DNA helicase RuvA